MIKIEMTGTTVSGNGRLMNDARLKGDEELSIRLDNVQVLGNAAVLDNLDTILENTSSKMQDMDRKEYEEIQKLLVLKKEDKREMLVQCIAEHVKEYSQGVLAKTITAFLKG